MKSMQQYMREALAAEKASPERIRSVDFEFDDPVRNARVYKAVLKKNYTTIKNTSTQHIIKGGTASFGRVVAYDRINQFTYFVSEYKLLFDKTFGSYVSQVLVWKSTDFEYKFDMIAYSTILDVLLPEFKIVATDKIQTEAGRIFWRRLIELAASRGLYYGLFNTKKKLIQIPEPGESAKAFLRRTRSIAYGWDDSYQQWRYFISTSEWKPTEGSK